MNETSDINCALDLLTGSRFAPLFAEARTCAKYLDNVAVLVTSDTWPPECRRLNDATQRTLAEAMKTLDELKSSLAVLLMVGAPMN